MIKTIALLLFSAIPTLAQNYASGPLRDNPARFFQTYWENTFIVEGTPADLGWSNYDILFPFYISTYAIPSCELTDADTGKAAPIEWVFYNNTMSTIRAPQWERIHITCMGYELKPWRSLNEQLPHYEATIKEPHE